MSRGKPSGLTCPVDLAAMRRVLRTNKEQDRPNDPLTAHYRKLYESDVVAFDRRKHALEQEHRKRLDTRMAARTEQQKPRSNVVPGESDLGTERCLEMLDKLIGELTGAQA